MSMSRMQIWCKGRTTMVWSKSQMLWCLSCGIVHTMQHSCYWISSRRTEGVTLHSSHLFALGWALIFSYLLLLVEHWFFHIFCSWLSIWLSIDFFSFHQAIVGYVVKLKLCKMISSASWCCLCIFSSRLSFLLFEHWFCHNLFAWASSLFALSFIKQPGCVQC